MYDELVKRMREFQAITEHCDGHSCDECENRELCDKYDKKTLSGTCKEAADALEELSREVERLRKAVLSLEDELGILDELPMVDQREPPKEE